MRAMRVAVGIWIALLVGAGCSGDDEVVVDASPLPDAPPDDGPGIDAENLCPGAFTFEALVADLESGTPVFDVTLAEVGDAGNTTTSAPNGRAVLCLPADTDAEVRSTKVDYLARLDVLSSAAIEIAADADQPYPLDIVTTTAVDALYTDLGETRDAADSQLVVAVLTYPDGEALVGATVAVDNANDGAYARDGSGDFGAGDTVAAGGVVLLVNTTTGDDAEITVTPPGDFDGSCEGPSTVSLEVDGMTGVLFACH